MMTARTLCAILLAASALAGCASTPAAAPTRWTGGDPAKLAADQAACHRDTDGVGLGANGYSDSRYGVSSALAEAIDRDDPFKNHADDARKAAFVTCMSDKGWRPG